MKVLCSKIYALVLILAMFPGAFEIMENASHLLADGHLAHAEAAGDQHQPTGPEHGCTPLFHACSCHVSLNFLSPKSLPAINLRAAQHMSPLAPDLQPTGFWPAIDRPPQV